MSYALGINCAKMAAIMMKKIGAPFIARYTKGMGYGGHIDNPAYLLPPYIYYFFAKFGRSRVLILKRGDVEIHSDIYGIEYIDVTNGVENAGEKIRKRISSIFE